jgi:hypothetical protein
MAGQIIISNIKTDSDNTFSILANTGAVLFSANLANGITTGIPNNSIANTQIISVANTKITGTITGSQISSNTVANTNIQTGAIENYSRDQYLSINRNKLINGDMRIDQRYAGANTVIPAYTATYVMDRWFGNAQPNASKFSMQQVNSANTSASNYESSSAPSGYANSMKVNSTTAMSVSTGEIYYVAQRIEGFNSYRLGWGAAGAKATTLSFWVKSSLTGTFGGSVVNSANDYCFPFSYTIVAANTWEQKFVSIPGPTSGSWKTDFNIGIQINFALATGSSYTATAGSWTGTANIFGATGQTNVLASQGNTWYLTGVQFEVGSTATNFEFRHQGTELAMCQRYYFKLMTSGNDGAIGSGYNDTTSTTYDFVKFPVTMRANPTLSASGLKITGVYSPSLTINSTIVGTDSATLISTTGSGVTAGQGHLLTLNSSTAYLQGTAEL